MGPLSQACEAPENKRAGNENTEAAELLSLIMYMYKQTHIPLLSKPLGVIPKSPIPQGISKPS